MSFRPLPVMTLCVLVSLFILAMLGNWQWQRYTGKLVALDAVPQWTALSGERVEDGVFYMSTILNGRAAWREILAMEVNGDIVLVTNGIIFGVETPTIPLSDPADTEPEFGEGIFRTPPAPGAFTPPSDMEQRILFGFDFPALEAALGRSVRRDVFEPQRLIARDETGEGMIDNPQANPALADPLPPARHLGYALTWWGIGLALLVMYFVYHAGTGRLKFGTRA